MIRMTGSGLLAGCVLLIPILGAAGAIDEESRVERQADVVRAVGLVRYFHPHDAVEAVDWNAVVLEAFSLADGNQPDPDFAASLAGLLAPIGVDIERYEAGREVEEYPMPRCEADEPLVRWVHRGFGASPVAGSHGIYDSGRSGIEAEREEGQQGFSTLMTTIPPGPLVGRSLRLSGQARLVGEGQAALWVRIDGPGGQMLFFDNMADRLVESEEWNTYVIDFEVPEEALNITVGVMALDRAKARFRGLELLSEEEEPEMAAPPVLPDREQWQLFSPDSLHEMQIESTEEGDVIVLMPDSQPAAQAGIARFLPEDAPASWTTPLVDGSRLMVPLALCREQARLDAAGRQGLESRFAAPALEALALSELARLDVAVLWPIVRHFYPYQELVDDWSAMLKNAIMEAHSVSDRHTHRRLLQRMLVDLEDGHVNVFDTSKDAQTETAWLPMALELVDDELVVANAGEEAPVRSGDRIVSIDGESASAWLEHERAHSSGSTQWRSYRATRELLRGERGLTRVLALTRGEASYEVELVHDAEEPYPSHSHAPVFEPADGVVYVNLDAIGQSVLDETIPRLAEAHGVIFDLRGYPRGINPQFLGHLQDRADDWKGWMRVLVARAPEGDLTVASRYEWGFPAVAPRIRAPVVFLTDYRAISYSESILGQVKYHGLGTIIGSTTAGSNGNILPLSLPGEFRVIYTGMRVIGPEGKPFQGQGIEPDVHVLPTLEGLGTGRDEVLERALEWILHGQ